ncbi:MAG: starch-binding protein, partial [Clostridiales bacterium]|nr:starch-binding protein [Clostridiales bacterium]
MSITDNYTGDLALVNANNGNASGLASSTYNKGASADKSVLWVESHDTYMGTSGSAGLSCTSGVSDDTIIKAWAIVGARADSTSLFFARPASIMGNASTDTTWKSTAVAEVNKFKNYFDGQTEYLSSSGSIAYVERGTTGVVLVNCSGTSTTVSVPANQMQDGTYTDTITGNTFTVSNGTISGQIGSTGVAVVYTGSTTPKNTCSVESGSFEGETLTLTLGLENATSGTYALEDGTPVTYTGTINIRIGSDYDYGDTIKLTLTATDGTSESSTVYTYTKNEAANTGIYVYLNASMKSSWEAPYFVYAYDEETEDGVAYCNGNWPGIQMNYDEASGYYYLEISSSTCVKKDSEGNVIDENATFDLAHSSNTRIIISSNNGQQQPATNGYLLESTSHIMFETTTSSSGNWTTTTLTPTVVVQDATEVTKSDSTSTTASTNVTEATEATTAETQATTASTEATQSTTSTSGVTGKVLVGDANGDGKITISDATEIQKHAAGISYLTGNNAAAADVDQSGIIDVKDATYVQYYLVDLFDNAAYCGQYIGEDETEATTASTAATQATTASTAATQATTATQATATTATQATTATSSSSSGTIYFTDNQGWGTVYAYFWSDSSTDLGGAWPGTAMTSAGDNGYGQTNYYATIPSGATYVIFTNGTSQTEDITLSSYDGYYTDGTTDSSGHLVAYGWNSSGDSSGGSSSGGSSSGGSSSGGSTSTSGTLYFTDNQGWGTVYAYFWSDSSADLGGAWPGTAMTSAGDNGSGSTNYSVSIPSGATYVIF